MLAGSFAVWQSKTIWPRAGAHRKGAHRKLDQRFSSSLPLNGLGISSSDENRGDRMKYREISPTNNLREAGWSWGCVSALDSEVRTAVGRQSVTCRRRLRRTRRRFFIDPTLI